MIYHFSNDWRFVFWGMDNEFSRLVLHTLLAKSLRPSSIFIPGSAPNGIKRVKPEKLATSLPMTNPFIQNRLVNIAFNHNLPIFEVQVLDHQAVLQTIQDLKPTLAIVACFPKRIPKEILDLPELGFLNLHPSLLPVLRGPYPLFWTFRLGAQPGITLHLMDEGLDTGPIVTQKAVDFSAGITGIEADQTLAREGVDLILNVIPQIEARQINANPQDGGSSTYPAPSADDFIIPTSWSARRAFNFIRGTAEWNHAYLIKGKYFQTAVRTANAFILEDQLNQPIKREGDHIWIQFNPGTLQAR